MTFVFTHSNLLHFQSIFNSSYQRDFENFPLIIFLVFSLSQKLYKPDGEDQVKKRQLMELAIINGTYRAVNQRSIFLPSTNLASELPLRDEDLHQQYINEHVIRRSHSPIDNSDIAFNRE